MDFAGPSSWIARLASARPSLDAWRRPGLHRFRSLRAKLTVLYAGLFALAMLLVSIAVYSAIVDNARRMVRDELTAGGAVFDRIWALRAEELSQSAEVLSRDFGFRSAVATGDRATTESALENLRGRLGIDLAFIVGLDGSVTSAGRRPVGDIAARLRPTFDVDDQPSGVFLVDGAPYQAIATPVMAPTAIGWVVFAKKLDRSQMLALEKLSAIPLDATVLHRTAQGSWASTNASARDKAETSRFITDAAADRGGQPRELNTSAGSAIALVKPLRSLTAGQPVVLLLRYPLARALAPYSPLLAVIVGVGVLGILLLVAGSWVLARGVTRPVSDLDEAVRRLEAGERASVEVRTDDEIGRLSASFNHMADRIRAREADLELARDQAEAANRAKSAFLANMSHEIRTPLNGVLGVAGMLSRTALDARQQQMVGIVEESAATLERVLGDVLDLARVEAGRMDFEPKPFDLAVSVRAMAAAADIHCRAKGLGFVLDMDPSAVGWVEADRARLEQVVNNLLSNAVKFTPRGEVRMTVARAADDPQVFRFEVRDTGIGFDPALTEGLFEPFRQADVSNTRQFGGAGLGLSISRELARQMGGDLTAESVPDQGSVFTLLLPLPAAVAPAEAVETVRPAPAEPAAQADTERAVRILLVDDHATNRKVVELLLEPLGVDLAQAENGQEAVDAFKAAAFDVVLMDLQMPVMDGLTAIRLIREHEAATAAAATPILVLSANAMPEHVQTARAAGADAHLAKPINAIVLFEALQKALSGETPSAATRAA